MSNTATASRSGAHRVEPPRTTTRPDDADSLARIRAKAGADEETSITDKLKAVGVDAEALGEAAKDQASELQRILTDEMQRHPMRTLGIAAAVGLFIGLLTTR
jgi:ElaB/YqjD/DUF883 family membrane-anchored ribosome-binding protein